MGSWNDFNDAQSNTNLIPKGTLAKVRLTIRPGGFDDASQGWTGGYAVVSRMWWKLASSALRACNVGSSQAARSRDIGSSG